MTSKREQVVSAVVALVTTAVPAANVKRNETKTMPIGQGGYINIMDGDPGDPEITLSPLTYIYEHSIMVRVAIGPLQLTRAETRLDAVLVAIGAAVDANRTLNGLCDYIRVSAPDMVAIEATGAETSRQADVAVVAIYGTPNPLT